MLPDNYVTHIDSTGILLETMTTGHAKRQEALTVQIAIVIVPDPGAKLT